MPGISSSLTEAAAAFAVGESSPMGLRCSGTSGALLGFVSQIRSGEQRYFPGMARVCPNKPSRSLLVRNPGARLFLCEFGLGT